jgi:hypothetical protein
MNEAVILEKILQLLRFEDILVKWFFFFVNKAYLIRTQFVWLLDSLYNQKRPFDFWISI